jgi:hypothetical protein
LVEPVVAIRRVVLEEGPGFLYGCCIQASRVLGWLLNDRGHAVEIVSCTANGWPHWCVRVGKWMLDPTAGQFGEDNPPLLFRHGSPDDAYEAGDEGSIELREDEIVDAFARWVTHDAESSPNSLAHGRSGAIQPLLELSGLAHLERRIQRAAAE